MTIRVINPGFLTSVQDLGRHGFSHLGTSPGGAADALSMRIANLLVGNEEHAPALEMTMLGPALEFRHDAVVAITGAAGECRLNSAPLKPGVAFRVSPGAILQCGAMTEGIRAYLAVRGGIDVPPVMGSAATNFSGRFGGFQGRRLEANDVLAVRPGPSAAVRRLRPGALDALSAARPIRVTPGAQHDWFPAADTAQFYSGSYTVSQQSDRSGLRLSGPAVQPRDVAQLLTEGVPLGAIQVPQDGQPIVLFVDQQTTGGYPKIANVIAADLHRVGQLRPLAEIRFGKVTIPEAIRLLREQEEWLRGIFVE
jgi:antagonist of KipI